MAEKGNKKNGNAASASPWFYYLISVLGVTISLAVAGLLFATFWLSRPVNLEPRTRELADLLELALVNNYVPPENIERDLPEARTLEKEKSTTYWTLHRFRVALPQRLNNDGLREILTKEMGVYNVSVSEGRGSDDAPSEGGLDFLLGEFKFAEMTVSTGVEAVSAAYRSDLRSTSLQLADLTERLFESLELATPHTRDAAVPKEDLNSLWNYTHFSAALPPGLSLGALKDSLEQQIAFPDARVETGDDLPDGVNLLITMGDRPCVGLSCTIAAMAPPAAPQRPSLDSVLKDGIQGSAPEEPMTGPDGVTPIKPPSEIDAGSTKVVVTPLPAPAMPAPQAETNEKPAPRLAIIIDDGGYVKADSERVLALDTRLTLAILPNTPHGVDTAHKGAELGFEIMLHMPMETLSGSEQAVEGTVFTAMGKKEIQKLTNNALDQYPDVVGVNNHTGSKFTENEEKMGFVLEVLKKRGLFFIDSYTMNTSVAYETAKKLGIPTERRDVFLDNEGDEESIRAQFEVLVKWAIEHGSAIGIGHFQKPNTAKVLAEEIPKLENAGIELVHASELVK